jgi:hypothetical protein
MVVKKIDPLRDCFDDFSLNGTILTIGGEKVDLADEEEEQEKIITFGSCNGKVHRGLMPRCVYVADVIIPPRKYETAKDEEADEGGGAETVSNALPLDTTTVTINVWPKVVDLAENENDQMEVNNAHK